MLRLEGFLLADEQSFVPRSLASVDKTYRHRRVLRHPALRVTLSRAYDLYRLSNSAFPRRYSRPAASGAKRTFSEKLCQLSTNRQHHSIRSLGPMKNRTVMQQPSA